MKYPTNGTVAEKAAYLREWGCGGCWRAADEIDKLAAENARLREVVQALLADAVILSRDYLKAFDHWPTTATIHGWEKAQWLRAADAADQARAALQGATR